MRGKIVVAVDWNAIVQNALFFKRACEGAKLCAVVKCNAYGHGIRRTAAVLNDIVDMFAVSNIYEANEIGYLNNDILILLPCSAKDTGDAIKQGYILTLDSFDTLCTINSVAESLKIKAHVHLKLDTGMGRLGFVPDELEELVLRLKNVDSIVVDGIFSHFASADCNMEYTQRQFDLFEKSCLYLKSELSLDDCICHIANTSATISDKKYHLDMVRIGLGLYGYGDDGLMPAKIVKGSIVAVKQLHKGNTVSYGNKYICMRDTKVAIISYGYSDGLYREWIDGLSTVEIKGKSCRVLGNVCMGMFMADISEIEAKQFDEVTVFGTKNCSVGNKVIVYELLCGLR
ncbi:MAG: alanine racemase [Corallococcus sp.]|nr:alanine racemase [Corallococcus sp.]